MDKLGILAGIGKYPVMFAKQAKANGCQVYAVNLNGLALPELAQYCDAVETIKLGKVGAVLNFFNKHGVKKIALSGMVRHSSVFTLIPDLRAAKVLAGLPDFRANTILAAVINEVHKEGMEVISSASFLQDNLVKNTVMTKRKPAKEEVANIKLGWKVCRALSGADVGLASVIADKIVIAVEAFEGTDLCIRRAGDLYKDAMKSQDKRKFSDKGLTVVKTARPNQDMRFDLPVIGKGTISSMLYAGAAALAVEAEKTLIIDKEEVIKMADDNKISIIGLNDEEAALL